MLYVEYRLRDSGSESDAYEAPFSQEVVVSRHRCILFDKSNLHDGAVSVLNAKNRSLYYIPEKIYLGEKKALRPVKTESLEKQDILFMTLSFLCCCS